MSPPYAVHERTHALLTLATSTPNAVHTAIVNLAAAYGQPRIVTTNFDDHLDSAAAAIGVRFQGKWIGPALPLGDTMVGLVHLHGSVTRSHDELVLTDEDLGRAYLTDGWATRFLLRLFQANVVVFIGYGLNDPTLRYLALGLPSDARLYAFLRTAEASDLEWNRLRVTPITLGDDHENLLTALQAWDRLARMGRLDHTARVGNIVASGPPLMPTDRDYLTARLRSVDGARDFTHAADQLTDERKLAWLSWLEGVPQFRCLFSPADVTEAAAVLGDWFSRAILTSPNLHGAALQIIQRAGQSMTPRLFTEATRLSERLSRVDPSAAERLRAILSTSVIGQSAPLDADAFLPFLPDTPARGICVLRSALRPFLKLETRWFVNETATQTALPDAKVTWRAEEYALTPHLRLAVQTAQLGDLSLGSALEDAVLAAYDLLSAYHGARPWDPLSFGRSAIEPHTQDDLREPADAVIDALREYGERALTERPDLPKRWWAFDHALFQRLALHLIAFDPVRTSDEKIDWVLSRSCLYAEGLKHEVYRVLAVAVPTASDASRQDVLAAVERGPDYPDDMPDKEQHSAYAKYNLLVWLTSVSPKWNRAAAMLAYTQQANPTFAPREHPDFDTWTSSAVSGDRLPMATEEFDRALRDSPAAAVDGLLAPHYPESAFDGPTWRDVLELVRQTVAVTAAHGLALWDELETVDALDGRTQDLQRAIVDGWARTDLSSPALRIVECVAQIAGDVDSADSVASFLSGQAQRQSDVDETPALAAMRDLAAALWRTHRDAFRRADDNDLLGFAPLYLNSWPGSLALYWLREIGRRWRHHRDDWSGLSAQEHDALLGLLKGPPAALDATRPALAGQLFFLFSADEKFTIDNVLPLFIEDETAKAAWNPYLYHPRFDDRLLAAGLLKATIREWHRLVGVGDSVLQQQYLGMVAEILSFAGISLESRKVILAESVIAADGAHAVDFAAAVVRFMMMDGVSGAQVWDHWLRGHVVDRISRVPRIADLEELARWADVVPLVGDRIPDAIALLSGHGIGLGKGFFGDLAPGVLAVHAGELVAFFAERVHNTVRTGNDFMVAFSVEKLVGAVRAKAGDAIAQPLIVAATAKGYLNDGIA